MPIRKSTQQTYKSPSDLGAKQPNVAPSATAVETWAREVFWSGDALAARSTQAHIGPSEVGAQCDRQLAYKMNGAVPLNPGGGSLSAIAGTGIHAWIADRIQTLYGNTNRYLTETRVSYRGVGGTCDLIDRLEHRVVDWKSTSEDGIRRLRKTRAWKPTWTVQTAIYGAGAEAAGERIEEVAIVVVPRSGDIDDIIALVRPYDRSIADAAIDRLEALKGVDPAEAKPYASGLCGWCPFFRPAHVGSLDLATGCPGMTAPSN